MDIARAVSIVKQNGSTLEKARYDWVVNGITVDVEIVRPFLELQSRDGGFPFGGQKENLCTVNDTLSALSLMDGLGLLDSTAAGQAIDYLLAVQKDDGGWDEDPAITKYELPSWVFPGDLRTRLHLSAYASYWLALKNRVEDPKFRKALYFLVGQQEVSGKFFGYLHTTWIAASVFALAGRPYSKIVSRCLKYLMEKPFDEWADSQIAWALECLGRAGLPKAHPFINDCLIELRQRQKSDGTWISEDGEACTIQATISVLKAFKIFGAMPG